MKSLLSILFMLLAFSCSAQKIRFTNSTNQWTTFSNDGDGYSFQNIYFYGTDTILSGITYKPLHSSWFDAHCATGGPSLHPTIFLREDTTSGIVYYLNPISMIEQILYNYNLGIGDSINYQTLGVSSYTDTVFSVDSTLINGIYHKILNFQNKTGYLRNYTVLEGIGCTNGPITLVGFGTCFEGGESLVCFYENDLRPSAQAPINS